MARPEKSASGTKGGESGRYETLVKIAAGGMGSVYVARARGALGFEQLVAVKLPHEHLLETKGFKKALLSEARVASKIRHANVVAIRDVDTEDDVISLVMDYVEGASLSDLTDDDQRLTVAIAMRVIIDSCAGLHAAHEVIDEDGSPLGLVHRDVSPQNILVGTDGVARITDFGIAKCLSATRDETTQGVLKGKLSYMAPDQVDGSVVDRRADVFALGVVLWELLTGARLFKGDNDAETIGRILSMKAKPPSSLNPAVPAELDAIVLKAVEKKRDARFATAEEFGDAIERVARASGVLATPREVGGWVRERVGPMLAERHAAIRAARAGEAPVDLSRGAAPPTETHSGVKPNDAAARELMFEKTDAVAAPAPAPAAAPVVEVTSTSPVARPLTPLERAATVRSATPIELAVTHPAESHARSVGPTGTMPTEDSAPLRAQPRPLPRGKVARVAYEPKGSSGFKVVLVGVALASIGAVIAALVLNGRDEAEAARAKAAAAAAASATMEPIPMALPTSTATNGGAITTPSATPEPEALASSAAAAAASAAPSVSPSAAAAAAATAPAPSPRGPLLTSPRQRVGTGAIRGAAGDAPAASGGKVKAPPNPY